MSIFVKKVKKEISPFNKAQVVLEIKDNLNVDYPHWFWMTSEQSEYDLVLMCSVSVMEQFKIGSRPFSEGHMKEIPNQYQIVLFADVTENTFDVCSELHPTGARVVGVDSYKSLIRHIKKLDKKEYS